MGGAIGVFDSQHGKRHHLPQPLMQEEKEYTPYAYLVPLSHDVYDALQQTGTRSVPFGEKRVPAFIPAVARVMTLTSCTVEPSRQNCTGHGEDAVLRTVESKPSSLLPFSLFLQSLGTSFFPKPQSGAA